MKPLPETKESLVLRTDFSDDAAWDAMCSAIQEPNEDGFRAFVDCVSDPVYTGITVEQLIALAVRGGGHTFAFVADGVAFAGPERPMLVVDLSREPGRTFRVIAREMWGVENNLSLANMDFSEFADYASEDGVFRGFPQE